MVDRNIVAFNAPQVKEPTPSGPLYQTGKTVGGAAAVLDFNKIMDLVLSNRPFFNSLPPKVQKGLVKLHKLSSNAFKFASDREAYFAGQGRPTLSDVKKYVENIIGIRELPESVKNALKGVQTAIKQEMTGESRPASKTVPTEEAQPQKVAPPSEAQPQSQKPDVNIPSGGGDAHEKLQSMFKKSKHYADIYPALPFEIRKELQRIGLDLESLKGSVKQASLGVVQRYLASR